MSHIARQTLLLTAIPLAFLLLLLGMSLVLQERNATIAAYSQQSAQVLGDADRAIILLGQANRSIGTFERSRNASALHAYDRAIAQLPPTLSEIQSLLAHEPAQRARANRLTRDFQQGIDVLNRYLRAVQRRDVAAQKRLADSAQVRALNAEITTQLLLFENAQRAATSAANASIHKQIQRFTIALIIVSLAGVALTMLFAIRFGLAITRRLMLLAQNARRLAQGKDTQPLGGADEIAQLDRVYQEMTRRIQSERQRVAALQRALLPQRLPTFPGIRLDAAYAPASGESEIGGDWYDVFQLSDRRIGISIGDVAGHGLRAAAIMGSTRQAIRTMAYFNDSPSDVLARVNQVLCRNEGGVLVTALYATLDLFDGTLQYSFAGHPAPLVVRTGRAVEHLAGSGFVLGVEPRTEYSTQKTQLEIGSALVLYTDGVIERSGEYLTGVAALEQAVEDEYREASHNIAHAIQARMLARGPSRDDSAVLFIGVTALGPAALRAERVVWTVDTKSEASARRVKRALLWHLGQIAGEGADLTSPELILSEMLGNVARHTPGPAEVVLEWNGDEATIRVCDQGPRFEPPRENAAADVLAESGRGIFLLRAMSRDFSVTWTGTGNCVASVLPLAIDRGAALMGAMA